MSLKVESSTVSLYTFFKTSSKLLINWLKFPLSALYELNIFDLDDLESSSLASKFQIICLNFAFVLFVMVHVSAW